YSHSQAFYDVAMSIHQSLVGLGHTAELSIDPNECEGTTLVFGAHLISKFKGSINGNYIIYQTEQLGADESLFADAAYIELLKRFPVWDYSLYNIKVLKWQGIE